MRGLATSPQGVFAATRYASAALRRSRMSMSEPRRGACALVMTSQFKRISKGPQTRAPYQEARSGRDLIHGRYLRPSGGIIS